MSLSKNECGWCTDVNEPPVDEHLYPFPDDIEGEVTAFFVGRESYPVGNTWHGILVYFISDDGRPFKTIAHRMYWYNRHGYGACLGKWEEGAIYSAWNSPFPVDFANKKSREELYRLINNYLHSSNVEPVNIK